MKVSKRSLSCLLMLLVNLMAEADMADLPYYLGAGLVPEWQEQLAGRNIHKVGDFELLNQQGEVFTGEDASEKIRVVNFFFATCPGICPTTMQNLKKVRQQIDPGHSMMLSFSITPTIDTPERLAEYAATQNIETRDWQLLTGDAEQIARLAQDSFFAVLERNVEESAMVHTEKAFLVDREGHIRGVYNATSPADVMRLAEDLQLLSLSAMTD